MKKLSLKMKGIGEMLSREQMKNVLGGKEFEGGGNNCVCLPTALLCSGGNPLMATTCYSTSFGNGINCCRY
ncbi:hypothetical protein [Daejeonella sp.]|uniref:hypothetical protein n=1 Tax=Daejeonella sp. TaxID=2805397 RepID=UPI0025C18019|nr:hypothetical protein [Daejeonella sp.]